MSKAPNTVAPAAAKSNTQTVRKPQARAVATLEAVVHRAPNASQAASISRKFGIDCPHYPSIRERTEEHFISLANELKDDLNEKAMEIHLQRIVGAFVGSAFGAATFYSNKATEAKDLTMKSQNDDRDEDRDGVSGFESKAQSARMFAANMGLQAYALMAAAEGAVYAYHAYTGETWKAYEPPTAPASSVERKSAAEELAAFD